MAFQTVSEEHLVYIHKQYMFGDIMAEGVIDVSEVQNVIDMISRWKPIDVSMPLPEVEMSDAEILGLPERTGIFSFLYDNAEDIYSESDGEPLE